MKYLLRILFVTLAAGYFLLRPFTMKGLMGAIAVLIVISISQYILYRMDRSPKYCARPNQKGEE